MTAANPIDAHNKFGVKAHNNGQQLALLMIEKAESMSREDALNLAAWLYVEAKALAEEFEEVVWQVIAHQKMQEASLD